MCFAIIWLQTVALHDLLGRLESVAEFILSFANLFCTGDSTYDLNFEPGATVGTEVCQSVDIPEDTIIENDMELVYTLEVVNSNDGLGNIVTHTITVTDNDGRGKLHLAYRNQTQS